MIEPAAHARQPTPIQLQPACQLRSRRLADQQLVAAIIGAMMKAMSLTTSRVCRPAVLTASQLPRPVRAMTTTPTVHIRRRADDIVGTPFTPAGAVFPHGDFGRSAGGLHRQSPKWSNRT